MSLTRAAIGFATSSIILVVAACTSTATNTAPGGSSTGSSTGGTSGSAAQCTPNTGDGKTACGSDVCDPGKYCKTASFCRNGCTASSNCAAGDYCDLSNKNDDGAGTCRACTPSTSSSSSGDSGSGAACGNYAGAYRFSTAAGSANECAQLEANFLGANKTCSFAQTDCAMTQTCGTPPATTTFTLDGNNKGKSTTNVSSPQGSGTVVCNYEFTGQGSSKFVEMLCQITAPAGVIVCNYTGLPN